jgi:hypothetical protein
MSNGRNHKTKKPKTAFEKAALARTADLSPEAARNFTSMVKEVAAKYSYDDSVMIRRLMSRLKQAARRKDSWAHEVLNKLEGATA